MPKKKKHVHSCRMGQSAPKSRSVGKKVSPLHKRVSKKALNEIYEKYYRSQLAALYRAIQE